MGLSLPEPCLSKQAPCRKLLTTLIKGFSSQLFKSHHDMYMPSCDKNGFFKKKQVGSKEITDISKRWHCVSSLICFVGAVLVVSRKAARKVLVRGWKWDAAAFEYNTKEICGLLNASKINISTEVLSATQRKMRECHTDMDMHRSTGLNKRMLNMYHSRKTQAAALHPLLNTPPHIYVIFSIGIFFMIIMLHNVNGKAVRITCFDHCTVIFIVFLCCYLIFRIIFKIVYTYCVVWSLTKSALSR